MSKLFYSIFAFLIISSSCTKSLDYFPLTAPTSANYWTSVNNLKLYANEFYPLLPQHSDGGQLGIYGVENNSDNLLPNTNDTRLNGKLTVPSTGGGWDFSKIREANYFLEHYQQVPTAGNEAAIRQYLGEIKFFRAYVYFGLLQKFGDLPWIGTTLDPDLDALQKLDGQVKRNIIADSIIADLDFAIANLLPKEKAEALRINSEIAQLFKSRVCLFEGTWEKYHNGSTFGVDGSNGSKYITLAATAAKAIIDGNKYSLAPNYPLLFNQKDLSANPEVLLWKKYNYLLGIFHDLERVITIGGGNTGLTKGLVDSYLCTDGQPIGVSPLYQGDKSLKLVMQNRDKRLLWTNAFPGYPLQIYAGNDTVTKFTTPPIDKAQTESRSTSGYQIYKGCDPYTDNRPVGSGEIACISFRYAEALLNYAEAMAELGTITQNDIDITINKLRDRAGVARLAIGAIATDPNWDFPALPALINEVRRERRVELACEGFRLNDLLRWKADAVFTGKRLKGMLYVGSDIQGTYKAANGSDIIVIGTNLYVDAAGYIDPYQKALPAGYEFKNNRDYLLPVPTNEITLSGGTLKQNPNW